MATETQVGRSVGHVEGPEKVSGRARYAGDMALPGMLWGKCLRSPFPSARILAIDTSRAKALPGVHAVLTGADLPERFIGRGIRDGYPLAREQVRFIGEKVVAVAAASAEIAEQALLLIDVEYEEMPAVFDPIEAMADGAHRVHDDPHTYAGVADSTPPIPNLVSQIFFRHGDIEAGFAEADRVFEHSFHLPSVHHGYIEPHACVIHVDDEGTVNCWLSNKAPFNMRRQLAAAADVPEDRVRIHLVPLGGDFGGKGGLMDGVVCYHLAARSGRPVKMVMTYTEELMAGNPRHEAVITMRTGVTNDGRMTARSAMIVFNGGAYAGFTPGPNLHGAEAAAGPYRLANVEIEARRVYTNNVPCGHMRAPGTPQTVFAEESHMDMIAHELGLHPLEFRLRNALEEGDESSLGEKFEQIAARETLLAADQAAGLTASRPPNVGRGMSMTDRTPGGGRSEERLTLDGDARFTLLTAVPDTGTGSHTILQQIVAEELQVPLRAVRIASGNTDTAAFDSGAGGSRVTHAAGQATLDAATKMRTALIDLAARVFNVGPEQVQLLDGRYRATDGRQLTLDELAAKGQELEEVAVTCVGSYTGSHSDVTSFVVQTAEVEVDPETGCVKVLRLVSAHDVGTIINPLTHQGQIEGGIIQGMGQAMSEHLIREDGAVTNANLGDYKLPTMADVPELTTVLLENKGGPTPYKGRAIGELSNVAVPAAIANAVYDAVGVRITELPITAEKVLAALRAVGRNERDSTTEHGESLGM